jgi:hypothetical protein
MLLLRAVSKHGIVLYVLYAVVRTAKFESRTEHCARRENGWGQHMEQRAFLRQRDIRKQVTFQIPEGYTQSLIHRVIVVVIFGSFHYFCQRSLIPLVRLPPFIDFAQTESS